MKKSGFRILFIIIFCIVTGCALQPDEKVIFTSATPNTIGFPLSTPIGETTSVANAAQLIAASSSFVHARNRDLVVGIPERSIHLRGINFSNYVWNNNHAQLLLIHHHSFDDYLVVKEMGMNVVRLNLSTYHFEEDDHPYHYLEDGWAWLDQEIQWAKAAEVYLILNIHFAPGMTNDDDGDIWNNADYRDRVTGVWNAIAERYAEEPVIAGYDLFNEPEPPNMTIWQEWVQTMVNAIRQHDTNHLIILEGVNGMIDETDTWSAVENPFVAVNDDNIMLDFHFYEPFEFTHQKMEWAGVNNTAVYPDSTPILDWEHMVWMDGITSASLSEGSTGWKEYTGNISPVMETDTKIGKPNPQCSAMGNMDTAYFGGFVVREYDSEGRYLQDVVTGSITPDQDWWSWSENGSGEWEIVWEPDRETHVIQMHGFAPYGTLSNPKQVFVVTPGHRYSITGWMRGEGIAPATNCSFSLELYGLTDGTEITQENKVYLQEKIKRYVDLAESMGRPLNLGEFGVNWYGWQDDRGGDRWYRDIFEIAVAYDLHFQSWSYLGVFGIFQVDEAEATDQTNWMMKDTLTALFNDLGPRE